MNTSPHLIKEGNISSAWRETLDHILNNSGSEITPLILCLSDFSEDQAIRATLDERLRGHKLASIQTVSETIFPQSLYEFCGRDRKALYETYHNNLPRLRKIDSQNARGTYFERLTAYNDGLKKINQLEIIIKSMQSKGSVRRSKLQASIFDPRLDHTNKAYQGFPCLQHVTFLVSEKGGLVMNSFYAIQYLYRRAYGNWLGLINLGRFIALEMDMELEKFNCYIGVEKLDELTKSQAKGLSMDLKK